MFNRIKFLFFITPLFVLALIYYFFNISLSSVSDDAREVEFLIPKGSGASKIAKELKNAGLIKNAIVFKFYTQLTNSQKKIQAGEYTLSANLTTPEIIEIFKKGPKELWVTIPEGLRREEIALRFAESLEKDEVFVKEFLNLTKDKEGYLFPDTYLFPKTATATNIVNKLTLTFDSKVGKVSDRQLIMASLLERETQKDAEKPIVAGVLYKRIENGWPLQVDATLQFAVASQKLQNSKTPKLERYWENPTSQDKELNSVFNTYKNLGLPPSPISNPGLISIQAAINPEESDYWYYIHDKTGQIHFAKTLEEHNLNIAKYLR